MLGSVVHHAVCSDWAQEFAYRHTVCHQTAHSEGEQEFAYSHTVLHHTARIEWSQEFAHSHTALHHTAHSKWAQEFAYSHTVFHNIPLSIREYPQRHVSGLCNLPDIFFQSDRDSNWRSFKPRTASPQAWPAISISNGTQSCDHQTRPGTIARPKIRWH